MLNKIYEQMERASAASKAKAARMTFGTVSHPTDARLNQIIQNNEQQVTKDGFAGAAQLFSGRYSSAGKKVAAAKQFITVRQSIRFHKIYNGKDVSKAGWTFTALDYVGKKRREAMGV